MLQLATPPGRQPPLPKQILLLEVQGLSSLLGRHRSQVSKRENWSLQLPEAKAAGASEQVSGEEHWKWFFNRDLSSRVEDACTYICVCV